MEIFFSVKVGVFSALWRVLLQWIDPKPLWTSISQASSTSLDDETFFSHQRVIPSLVEKKNTTLCIDTKLHHSTLYLFFHVFTSSFLIYFLRTIISLMHNNSLLITFFRLAQLLNVLRYFASVIQLEKFWAWSKGLNFHLGKATKKYRMQYMSGKYEYEEIIYKKVEIVQYW